MLVVVMTNAIHSKFETVTIPCQIKIM